mgnify:CR=1 FL=1
MTRQQWRQTWLYCWLAFLLPWPSWCFGFIISTLAGVDIVWTSVLSGVVIVLTFLIIRYWGEIYLWVWHWRRRRKK